MDKGEHKVGSIVGDVRVPEAYAEELARIAELVNIGETPEAIGRVAIILSSIEVSKLKSGESFDGGIFGSYSSFEKRYIPDYRKLETIVNGIREMGHKIVLTMGTFDIVHIGHARYLEKAKQLGGDFLVVGVDSDEKVEKNKGMHRPIVPQDERLRMLAQLRGVDVITLKDIDDPKWHLIKTIKPDTLIATEGTYSDQEISILSEEYVDQVLVLPPQASTSTTARLRKYQIDSGTRLNSAVIRSIKDSGAPKDIVDKLSATIQELFESEFN